MDTQDGAGKSGDSSKGGDVDRPMIYTSEELIQGRGEAWIEHNGQMYRLRITAKGNLILTR